jgi:Lar family restriction alleviation protein
MEDLKPCPFCGSASPTLQFRNEPYPALRVVCDCGAKGPAADLGDEDDMRRKAVEGWNHRE